MTRWACVPAVLLMVASSGPSAASVSVDFSDYLPLQVGNRWTLQDERGNLYQYHIPNTEVIEGEVTYQFVNWEGNPGYCNLTYRCGALKISAINGEALDPVRLYDGRDIDNPAIHIIYEMAPVVQTPAGSFTDVIRETIYTRQYSPERKTRVQYFARGVGLVRDEEWSADAGGIYVYAANLVSYEKGPNWLPMIGPNADCAESALVLCLYDLNSGDFRVVKNNCYRTLPSFQGLNESQTKMVYAETAGSDYVSIQLYDIADDGTETVLAFYNPEIYHSVACFDSNDRIVFHDARGAISRMDLDGGNLTTLAGPESPYRLGVFWMSPDRTKIVAIESESGEDYETSNYERLVLFNSDGSGRRLLHERYLGEWNAVSWRPDSTRLLFYYHTFNGEPRPFNVKYARYVTFDISQDPILRTDLSASDLGSIDGNVCWYTRTGELLSVTTGQLYDPLTGSLLADCSESVTPFLSNYGIAGTDVAGGIYFADPNGQNFQEFNECACR